MQEIGERVGGFGGDPGSVEPDPNGFPGGLEPAAACRAARGGSGFTGKVSGVLYDRYGDFEGFTLETRRGSSLFRSREHTIEDIAVRAWRERTLIVVYVGADDPRRPETILLRYGPRPYWG